MFDNQLKVILLGDSGVGKTSLIRVATGENFNKINTMSTIASYFVQKTIQFEGKEYILNLWDTAGQETYLGVTKLFFKGSEIVIFVYDITSLKSYESLENWINMAEEIIENSHICAIVGNKNDLYLNAEVKEEQLKNLATSKNYLFKVVSAKTNPKDFTDFLFELFKEYQNRFNSMARRQTVKLKSINTNNDPKANEKNKCC